MAPLAQDEGDLRAGVAPRAASCTTAVALPRAVPRHVPLVPWEPQPHRPPTWCWLLLHRISRIPRYRLGRILPGLPVTEILPSALPRDLPTLPRGTGTARPWAPRHRHVPGCPPSPGFWVTRGQAYAPPTPQTSLTPPKRGVPPPRAPCHITQGWEREARAAGPRAGQAPSATGHPELAAPTPGPGGGAEGGGGGTQGCWGAGCCAGSGTGAVWVGVGAVRGGVQWVLCRGGVSECRVRGCAMGAVKCVGGCQGAVQVGVGWVLYGGALRMLRIGAGWGSTGWRRRQRRRTGTGTRTRGGCGTRGVRDTVGGVQDPGRGVGGAGAAPLNPPPRSCPPRPSPKEEAQPAPPPPRRAGPHGSGTGEQGAGDQCGGAGRRGAKHVGARCRGAGYEGARCGGWGC